MTMSLKERIAAQRKAISDRSASFTRAYKFKEGKTYVRLLPGVEQAGEYSQKYGAHYIKDPSTGSILAVVGDAETTYEKYCPVRDAIGQVLARASDRGDEELAKKVKGWFARGVYVMNVQIVAGVDTENKDKVVQPEFSEKSYDALLSIMQDMEEANANFDDDFAKKGVTITVERVGMGATDTRYTFSMAPSQPKDAIPQPVLDQRVSLQAYVDGKFGASVAKALQHLSVMLGKDVTQTALGAAMVKTVEAIPGPATKTTTAASADEELLSLEGGVTDAEFVETPATTVVVEPTPAAAVTPADDAGFKDILAELDAL